jgi:hypothetical protein
VPSQPQRTGHSGPARTHLALEVHVPTTATTGTQFPE